MPWISWYLACLCVWTQLVHTLKSPLCLLQIILDQRVNLTALELHFESWSCIQQWSLLSFLLSPFLDFCAGACLLYYRCFTCPLQKRKKKARAHSPSSSHAVPWHKFVNVRLFSTNFSGIRLLFHSFSSRIPCGSYHRSSMSIQTPSHLFRSSKLTELLSSMQPCRCFENSVQMRFCKYSTQTPPIIQINLTN